MSGVVQILGARTRRLASAPARGVLLALAAAALLAGCGQKGPLVLPTGAAATGRAPLPDTLLPEALRPSSETEPSSTAIRPGGAASTPAGTPAPSQLPPTGTASPGHTDQ